MFEGSHDCDAFLIVDLVVALSRAMLCGKESHWVEDAILAILRQDPCGNVFGGIGFDDNIAVEAEVGQYGSRGETSLELLEGKLLVLVPMETLVLPGKFSKWSDHGGEAMDKTPVEVREA